VPAQLLNCREIVGSTKRARLGAPATAPRAQPPTPSRLPRRGKEARDAVTALVTSRALPLAASRAIGRASSDDSRQTAPCVRRDRSGNERVPRSVTVTAERARRVQPSPLSFPLAPYRGIPSRARRLSETFPGNALATSALRRSRRTLSPSFSVASRTAVLRSENGFARKTARRWNQIDKK